MTKTEVIDLVQRLRESSAITPKESYFLLAAIVNPKLLEPETLAEAFGK